MTLKDSSQFDFLDTLAVASFILGLENLELNIAQEDLDNQTKELDRSLREVVDDIHAHLKRQDELITAIWEKLNEEN